MILVSSRSRSSHRAVVPLRSRAFAAAARYRADYGPDHDADTVAAGVAASDPALAHRPGLVAAAAQSPPPLDPADAASRQIARLASSVLTRETPPVSAMDAWRLVVVVAHLVEEVEDGSSYGSGLLVTTTRAAYWWGVSQPTASVALQRLLDSGALVVTGRAGRSRRMRLGIGSPSFDRVDEWLDPTHPWWTCTDPSIAYAPDAATRGRRVRRWLAVVRGEEEGAPVEPDPAAAAARQAEGLARYRDRAEASRRMILGWQEGREADRVMRRVMRGLPPAGSDREALGAWMRLAIQRAAGEAEVDSARVAAVAEEAGHSESVARQLGSRLSDAAGTAQGWGTF